MVRVSSFICCQCGSNGDDTPPRVCLDNRWSRELNETFTAFVHEPPRIATEKEAVVNLSFMVKGKNQLNYSSFRRLQPMEMSSASLGWTESRIILEEQLQLQGNDDVTIQDSFGSEELRLTLRLKDLNLGMQIQLGDGNCQFRSVSKLLFGSPEHHLLVRSKAIEYMEQNKPRFQNFLGEDFALYLKEMSRAGSWGDELTLRAIAESFQIMISVITSASANWFIRYVPGTTVQGEIFLAYVFPVHYNALQRISSKGKRRHTVTALPT